LIEHLGEMGYPATVLPFDRLKAEFDELYLFGFILGTFIAQVFVQQFHQTLTLITNLSFNFNRRSSYLRKLLRMVG